MVNRFAGVRLVAVSTALLALGGCVAGQGSFSTVRDIATRETGSSPQMVTSDEEAAAIRAATTDILRRPLTPDAAVRLAFSNSRLLQAAYNEIGIADAALIKASLPANPKIGINRTTGGGSLEVERELLVSIYSLATLPARRDIATEQLRAAQMRATEATLRIAMDARRQFYRAVAAGEKVAALRDMKLLTDASSDLAQKLGESGALNKLDQARELVLAAEIDSQLASAQLEERIERERLIRALGLWGDQTNFKLPSRLPKLPAAIRTASDAEVQAIVRRVDLQAARHDLAALATSLGLTQVTRFVTDADLTGTGIYARSHTPSGERETERTKKLALEIEIPLFDFGTARALDAEQRYLRAANLLADKAIRVRSEAREAYMAYRGTYEIARHHETRIQPLREIIQEESLLHYSGMLSDVTALIVDTKARMTASMRAIDAKRDFWIAETELRAALAGGGSGVSISGGSSAPSENPAGH